MGWAATIAVAGITPTEQAEDAELESEAQNLLAAARRIAANDHCDDDDDAVELVAGVDVGEDAEKAEAAHADKLLVKELGFRRS